MPKAKKKFFIQKATHQDYKQLLGTQQDVTLAELLDFLKEKRIDPASVRLNSGFTVFTTK